MFSLPLFVALALVVAAALATICCAASYLSIPSAVGAPSISEITQPIVGVGLRSEQIAITDACKVTSDACRMDAPDAGYMLLALEAAEYSDAALANAIEVEERFIALHDDANEWIEALYAERARREEKIITDERDAMLERLFLLTQIDDQNCANGHDTAGHVLNEIEELNYAIFGHDSSRYLAI